MKNQSTEILPEEVYDHIMYGNGATPKASLEVNGIEYGLENIRGKIVARIYNGVDLSKEVSLSDIPIHPLQDWELDWINEC